MQSRAIGRTIGGLIFVGASLYGFDARAAECWEVVGWSSPDYVGAEAVLQPADCTTIPEDYGWAHITLDYGTPPNDDLYLLIDLADSRVSGWIFEPLLVFSGYDGGEPEVFTDLILCTGCDNEIQLLPFPPEQGVPNADARVRLRHRYTDNCIYSLNSNGATARNRNCWADDDMTYILEDAGGGYFRLRNELYSQCLYNYGGDGDNVHNWGCWADPNMEYALDASTYGYRLRHRLTSSCIFGNSTYGGSIFHWGCWADPNMEYYVDIIEYG